MSQDGATGGLEHVPEQRRETANAEPQRTLERPRRTQAWFPKALDQLTVGWLTDALRDAGVVDDAKVVDLEVGPLAEGGAVSTSASITLAYDRAETPAPTKVFAKMPPSEPAPFMRPVFRREVGFYREFALTLGRGVPRPYGAWWDGDLGFLLLLEDLSDERVGSWWTWTAREAAAAFGAIVSLHSDHWATSESRSWLAPPAFEDDEWFGHFAASLDAFRSRQTSAAAESLIRCGRAVIDGRASIVRALRRHPQTITHGDFHAQNLFVSSSDAEQITIFDWQAVRLGQAGIDLAYHLTLSLETATRRAHEGELIRSYHSRLRGLGITDYPMDQLTESYRLGVLAAVRIVLLVMGQFPQATLDAMARHASAHGTIDGPQTLVERVAAAVADHGLESYLR